MPSQSADSSVPARLPTQRSNSGDGRVTAAYPWLPHSIRLLAVLSVLSMCLEMAYADEESNLLKKITSFFPKTPIAFEDNPANFRSLASAIVRENLPNEYVDDRKWGMTKEFYSGLSVKRDGLRIRTHRKRTHVNHGTWKQYRIQQIKPEENVVFEIGEPKTTEDGTVEFEIVFTSKVQTYARLSEWNRGIRLASISVDADAKVRLSLLVELGLTFDPTKLPPDVILQPRVNQADIQIREFTVHRISKIDGKIARELGRGLRKILEKKVAEKRPKLVSKINKKIEENQDDLRFSVSDLVAKKWENLQAKPKPDLNSL